MPASRVTAQAQRGSWRARTPRAGYTAVRTRVRDSTRLPMTAAVEFDSVSKTFGTRLAVDRLSLKVAAGSLYGFIGPNGSGKTTTLRMMLGILYPDAGDIRVLGQRTRSAVDDRTGYLPEERGLYRRMRVFDVLKFHAQLKNVRRPEARISEWLTRLELMDHTGVRVSGLSKGLAQRVQFAVAVMHEPALLVLDEPFSGLDPVSHDLLCDIILALKRRGTTIVLSTHDMTVAERLCDSVLMLHRGQKVLDGLVHEMKQERAGQSVHVCFDRDVGSFDDPSVSRGRNYGREHVLDLVPGADPQKLLARLMQKGCVLSFSVVRPSLHDIFVEIARGVSSRSSAAPTLGRNGGGDV